MDKYRAKKSQANSEQRGEGVTCPKAEQHGPEKRWKQKLEQICVHPYSKQPDSQQSKSDNNPGGHEHTATDTCHGRDGPGRPHAK